MKNQRGISLITLIVTILVMIILLGVVGKYSLDSIKEGQDAVSTKEISDVRNYVLSMQSKIIAGDFKINVDEYPEIVLSADLLYTIAYNKLTDSEIGSIIDVNASSLNNNYKYYYFQASNKLFEDTNFSENGLVVQDVKGDYIVNFYTGTIILITEDAAEVEGLIKGLSEISVDVL